MKRPLADFSFPDLALYNETRRILWRRGQLGLTGVAGAFASFEEDGAWLLHGNDVWSLPQNRDKVPLVVVPFGGRVRVSGIVVDVSGMVYGQHELRDHSRLDAETLSRPTPETTSIVFSGRVHLGWLVAAARSDVQLFRRSDLTDVRVGVLRLDPATYREATDG